MRKSILDLYFFGSPFHTPRAVLWNIRTLGLACWVQCVIRNACYAAAERLWAFGEAYKRARALRPTRASSLRGHAR